MTKHVGYIKLMIKKISMFAELLLEILLMHLLGCHGD